MHKTRPPHLLPPEAYFDEAHQEREFVEIFRPGWHCIGSIDDLPRHGDFISLELLGTPLLVRNDQHKIRGFLNVCAHRHALLTCAPRGSMPRLRCQYHGWEYGADGGVVKIPDAACFVPLKKGEERLLAYRTECLGKLIWVCLAGEGPSLREQLGERVWSMAEQAFSSSMRQGVALELVHPCNWKIPIENALDSYQLPFQAPELGDRFTVAHDVLGGVFEPYRALIRWFWPRARFDFEHLHSFPNVLFGRTSGVSFLQVVNPVTPVTSRSTVRIFLELGRPGAGALESLIAPLADRLARGLFLKLISEDAPIDPAVQRVIDSNSQRGGLGSRAERIHPFHTYIAAAYGLRTSPPSSSSMISTR